MCFVLFPKRSHIATAGLELFVTETFLEFLILLHLSPKGFTPEGGGGSRLWRYKLAHPAHTRVSWRCRERRMLAFSLFPPFNPLFN